MPRLLPSAPCRAPGCVFCFARVLHCSQSAFFKQKTGIKFPSAGWKRGFGYQPHPSARLRSSSAPLCLFFPGFQTRTCAFPGIWGRWSKG